MKRRCIIGAMGLILSVTAGADQIERMAVVPADTYLMGDGAASRGLDPHRVTLTHDFYLGLYEVTNQEYLEAVQWAHDHGYVTATATAVYDKLDGSNVQLLDLDGGCELGFTAGVFGLRDTGHGVNPDHPVKEVTWYGAARFCDWLSLRAGLPRAYAHGGDWSCNGGDPYGAEGYRLPTNAEWEYAARFDEAEVGLLGRDVPPCERANCLPGDSLRRLDHAGGELPRRASGAGTLRHVGEHLGVVPGLVDPQSGERPSAGSPWSGAWYVPHPARRLLGHRPGHRGTCAAVPPSVPEQQLRQGWIPSRQDRESSGNRWLSAAPGLPSGSRHQLAQSVHAADQHYLFNPVFNRSIECAPGGLRHRRASDSHVGGRRAAGRSPQSSRLR